MKALWALLVGLLLAGCSATGNHPFPPRPDLARYDRIQLAPITFSTHQALSSDRDIIARVLKRELHQQLEALGYTLTDKPTGAAARLDIDITYIWDERLYDYEDRPLSRLFPDLRLYADVTVTDLASGNVVLQEEALGEGPIEPVWAPAPDARYAAPQRELARRIGGLFPSR